VLSVAMPAAMREFAWSPRDFARVQALIHQRAGISLNDGKHAMVYSRLSRRLRETGHASLAAYLDWLEYGGNSAGCDAEWQEFINALTTNLTAFFREAHHFDILQRHLRAHSARAWRIWCAAASTGEEPYSIAMTAMQALGDSANVQLVASDIDSRVLASAAAGIYRIESTKGLGTERLQRFFLRGKLDKAGMVRVKPALRRMVEFFNVNLARKEWPAVQARGPFDVVFCRNVMIYFDVTMQRQVLERIHRVMRPGGLLFVGHAENFAAASDLFRLKGKTVYECH